MINVYFAIWFVAFFVVMDAQTLHPIQIPELKDIVESVQKDVDKYLRLTSAGKRIESISLPNPPKLQTVVVEDFNTFMKMIQDSMHFHLVRNMGPPSDADSSARSSKSIADENLKQSLFQGIRFGSIKGVPGVNFPDYTDIPVTHFSCNDKEHLPGFYADMETGCQVFHACWPDRRETFLCPMGTVFNQALLVCDYWYNSNCSLSPHFYIANAESAEQGASKIKNDNLSSMINTLLESSFESTSESLHDIHATLAPVLSFVSQFIPVRAKIAIYPETTSHRPKIVASASIGKIKKSLNSPEKHKTEDMAVLHGFLSDEATDSSTDAETSANEIKKKIILFRFKELLERIQEDIHKVDFIFIEFIEDLLKHILEFLRKAVSESAEFLPGSEFYEYDKFIKQFCDKMYGKFQWLIGESTDENDKIPNSTATREVHDLGVKRPLTHLNPRFIVKPVLKQNFEALKGDAKTVPVMTEGKLAETVIPPSKVSSSERLIIYPGTKKALLKNYIKLFKAKSV